MNDQLRASSARPYAFVFWQDVIGHPAYIDLCRDTMRRNLTAHFELVELDLDSCRKLWPEALAYFERCEPVQQGRSASKGSRQMALFSDLLRVRLLADHGGLWVDADTIVFPRAETLARLAQRDFFCSEAELNTLANGVMGGRPGSPFLAAMVQRMHESMDERIQPVGWGEFGFQLIKRVATERDDDIFVIPFGHLIQFFGPTSQEMGRATTSASAFSSGAEYDDLVPADAIAMCMFNNSTTEEQREQSRDQVLAGQTMFAEAYRRAMSEPASTARLLETQNRAVFSRHMNRRELETTERLADLRGRLTDRNRTVRRMRERITHLTGRVTTLRERNATLGATIAELRERNKRFRHPLGATRADRSSAAVEETGARHRRSVFQNIFEDGLWAQGGSKSGCGSSIRQTETLRATLPTFLGKHGVRSLLDLPCGDFNWMQHLDLGDIRYVGGDVVSTLIEQNRARFPEVDFRVLDLVSDPLPDSDCLMVRDCFSHLSFDDIHQALDNVRSSAITYLLVTHFADERENADISTGQFHRLNFRLPPFSFGEPIDVLLEEHPNPRHADKCLALWRVRDLPPHGTRSGRWSRVRR